MFIMEIKISQTNNTSHLHLQDKDMNILMKTAKLFRRIFKLKSFFLKIANLKSIKKMAIKDFQINTV